MQEVKSFAFYDEDICKKVEKTLKQMRVEISLFKDIEIKKEKDEERPRWFLIISSADIDYRWLVEFVRLAYKRICGIRYTLKNEHDRINMIYSCRPFKGWGYREYQMVISPT